MACDQAYRCGDDPNSNCSICLYNEEYMESVTDEDGNTTDPDARFYVPSKPARKDKWDKISSTGDLKKALKELPDDLHVNVFKKERGVKCVYIHPKGYLENESENTDDDSYFY